MIQRSLPLRILLVNFILLILPLLLYFFFVFRMESKNELDIVTRHLKSIASSKAALLSEIAESGYTSLSVIINLLGLSAKGEEDKASQLNNDLRAFAKVSDLYELNYFYITPTGDFIVFASSELSKIGKDFTFRTYLPEAIQNGRSAYLGYHTQDYGKDLFLSQGVFSDRDGTPIGVLTIDVPIELVLKKLIDSAFLPFDARISLLTRDGIVFASSDPAFEMNAFYPISEEKLRILQESDQFGPYLIKLNAIDFNNSGNRDNTFTWEESGSTRLGIKVLVPGTTLSIFIDCDKNLIENDFYKHLWELALIISIVAILTAFLNLFLTYRIGKPLKQLFNVMNKISEGYYEERFKPDPFGYEINDLGSTLNQMVYDLNGHIEDVKNEKAAREILAKELKIGRDIQMSILPQEMPNFGGLEIQARSLPALEVGGDFYDLYVVTNPANPNEKRLIATVADGAGKGSSACLYSLCLRSILRAYAAEYLPVGKVMQLSNNLFYMDTERSSMFATAMTVSFDLNSKKMTYYSAGHTPCFIRKRDGTIRRLDSHGMAMGVIILEGPLESSVELETSDLIVLYTDGVTDAQNVEKKLFGEKRLMEFLKTYGNLPVPMIIKDLYREIENFTKGVPQYDDITVVMMRVL